MKETSAFDSMPSSDDTFERLTKYEPWLRLIAGWEMDSRLGQKYSASDVVQQTMLEAWKDWSNFEGDEESQRRAWLRRILANQLAHFARHYAGTKKRDIAREQSIDAALANSSMRLERILSSDQSTPSRQAVVNEQTLKLAQALEQLPEDYREVIRLRNLEALSHEEVAKRMNRSVGAVRMLWVRALAELRKQIDH